MSACRRCRAPIGWKREGERWVPVDPGTGAAHACPAATGPIPSKSLPPETGALYQPSCGQCGIPPWEVCPCSKLLGVPA